MMAECMTNVVSNDSMASSFTEEFGEGRTFCKKCELPCTDNKFHKCRKCQAPCYWSCPICHKELMSQSRYDHAKRCSEAKIAKRMMFQAKLADERKKWKRSTTDSDSHTEDSSKRPRSASSSPSSSDNENGEYTGTSNPGSFNGGLTRRLSGSGSISDGARSPLSTSPRSPESESKYIGKVKALYKYTGLRKDDLSFEEGAIIHVISKRPSGWWLGDLNGKLGMFPSNYVEEVQDAVPPTTRKASIDAIMNPEFTSVLQSESSTPATNGKGPKSPGKASPSRESETDPINKLKQELELYKTKCREYEEKIRAYEKEKSDTIKELTYVKAVLESSLNYKKEEEEAVEGLEALQSLRN